MKKKELQELKRKPRAEVKRFVEEAQVRLRNLKFDLAAGKVKNVREVRILRKDIARALTVLTLEKEEK